MHLIPKQVPSTSLYKEILKRLIEIDDITTILIIRLAAEGSMCRIEIANARTEDINRYHPRGLWVETAKRVRGRHAKKSRMRQREIPLNISLYNFIQQHVDFNQKYILERKGRGEYHKPFHPQHLNYFVAKKNNLPFTIQNLRKYFKTEVWQYMLRNKQPDVALVKEIMGHQKTVHESYGVYSWEYKLAIVDSAFCEIITAQSNNLQAIVKAIKNGFDSVQPKNKMWEGNCPFCQAAITAPIFVKRVECPNCNKLLDVIH